MIVTAVTILGFESDMVIIRISRLRGTYRDAESPTIILSDGIIAQYTRLV